MKKSVLFLILLLISIFQTQCGSSHDNPGRSPTINCAYFWNFTNHYETDILYLETQSYALNICCYDPDLDAVSLYITAYDPTDPSVPVSGPDFFELTPQTSAQMTYATEQFIPEGEPRERKLELQIEDAKGNVSNIYRLYYSIEKPS